MKKFFIAVFVLFVSISSVFAVTAERITGQQPIKEMLMHNTGLAGVTSKVWESLKITSRQSNDSVNQPFRAMRSGNIILLLVMKMGTESKKICLKLSDITG